MAKKSVSKGYVYILTNPSFREDWVKIGKSANEVDLRSKRLSNTSIPLPFEIYATIKTSKYSELEKLLHEVLDDLAKSRINPKREFFNITPQKAGNLLRKCAATIADAELNFPDEDTEDDETNASGKKTAAKHHKKGKYTVNTNKEFKVIRDTVEASMVVKEGKRYIVLAGARIDNKVYSNSGTVKRLRAANAKYLKHGITTKDIEFNSPSSAGMFVGGGACNGKYYWRTKEGKPLNDFITYTRHTEYPFQKSTQNHTNTKHTKALNDF